jgi:thiamine biosynthesis lipoprotein
MVALGRYMMGTRFEIVLCGEDDESHLRAAGEGALDEIERVEGLLSIYQPDSAISQLNARAAGGWVNTHPEVFALLKRALELSRETGGAFDISVLPLLRAWGFVGGGGHTPDPAEVCAARALVGCEHVALDSETCSVRYDRAGVGLDLGAIGKGYALDVAVGLLRESGVTSALLHGGTSTVTAIGCPDDKDAWLVAIRDPESKDGILETVSLGDGAALSVSGAHGKCFTGADGGMYGHVLDPRTGAPARAAKLAAVIAPTATEADALSTAVLVLGEMPVSTGHRQAHLVILVP